MQRRESETKAQFYVRLEQLLGTPDDPASLAGRTATFEAALVEAASRPDSQPRLQAVVDAATSLTSTINTVSDGIQQARMDAEGRIALQVDDLNRALAQVKDLNERIVRSQQVDRDASALLDQRQQIIDDISVDRAAAANPARKRADGAAARPRARRCSTATPPRSASPAPTSSSPT